MITTALIAAAAVYCIAAYVGFTYWLFFVPNAV